MMRGLVVRGVDFGPVSVASGTLNNFGEGWPYHARIKSLPEVVSSGFDFTGATLVSKTATLARREGNMPLDKNFQPLEWFPRCIYVNHRQQLALNAVSLSGPGIIPLLAAGKWQQRKEAFFISVMAADGDTEQDRLLETEALALAINRSMTATRYRSKFGVQQNVSCPNIKHDPAKMAHEAIGLGEVMRGVLGDIPLDLKINAMTPIRAVKLIQQAHVFDSLTCSNTIPWGQLPGRISWQSISSSGVSPLIKRGFKQPGGLSGQPLLPIVYDWVREARADGITMPITAGGGIVCPPDVDRLVSAGADAVAIGSVAFLRFWNVKPCIERAYQIAGRRTR